MTDSTNLVLYWHAFYYRIDLMYIQITFEKRFTSSPIGKKTKHHMSKIQYKVKQQHNHLARLMQLAYIIKLRA